MSSESTDAVVILSTAPKEEEAVAIASALVEGHLAACVNIVPGVRSLYFWEGKVQDDSELLLVIKTSTERRDQAVAKVREVHSYTCPEAIVLPLAGGSPDYLKWIAEVTR